MMRRAASSDSIAGVVAASVADSEAQRRTRAQFKAVPVPTYAWQQVPGRPEDFVLVDHNDAAEAFTEGHITGLVGASLLAMYADDPAIVDEVQTCLRERRTLRREIAYRMRSVNTIPTLMVTYVPAPPDLVIVYTEDLTERAKLEEQLRHSQKMEAVGQLAGGVAHDFNNLLTVIQSFADGLAEQISEGDPRRADVEEIRKAALRATTLTGQLLAFSRKQVLQPRPISLTAVARALEPMVRRLIGEHIAVRFELAEGLPLVHADPGQIEQVIVNLAVNARDAMARGGTLTVRTYLAEDGSPRLTVRDTGHGMDEATRQRIFEPFFTTKERGRGTGLGLATVYGIVQQSGGSIEVESAPGQGTSFELRLPLATTAAAPVCERVPDSRVRPGMGRILLVEDEDAVRSATRRMLERAGYTVSEARDAREALALAGAHAFDMLVTDVVMPGQSGPELHARLLSRQGGRKAIPVLFLSGYTNDSALRGGQLPPGARFLNKPFARATLLEQVREALDEARGAATAAKPGSGGSEGT